MGTCSSSTQAKQRETASHVVTGLNPQRRLTIYNAGQETCLHDLSTPRLSSTPSPSNHSSKEDYRSITPHGHGQRLLLQLRTWKLMLMGGRGHGLRSLVVDTMDTSARRLCSQAPLKRLIFHTCRKQTKCVQ
jgi:hypothetical protein